MRSPVFLHVWVRSEHPYVSICEHPYVSICEMARQRWVCEFDKHDGTRCTDSWSFPLRADGRLCGVHGDNFLLDDGSYKATHALTDAARQFMTRVRHHVDAVHGYPDRPYQLGSVHFDQKWSTLMVRIMTTVP